MQSFLSPRKALQGYVFAHNYPMIGWKAGAGTRFFHPLAYVLPITPRFLVLLGYFKYTFGNFRC